MCTAEQEVVVITLKVPPFTSYVAYLFHGRWNRVIVHKFQDSLENVTANGSIPIPNEAAPRRPAVKIAELILIASSWVFKGWENVNGFRLQRLATARGRSNLWQDECGRVLAVTE